MGTKHSYMDSEPARYMINLVESDSLLESE